ncbi:flagellar protein MotX [Saccharobesus litoralis]|uniref:Flagellar protein MotX n=1 Tax=Saccharobesus litoralis TaxID=2172099 RepID=A0A2S0VY02_9ALTE|nr:tetratricopeptide repeat protein [Saccharobesus litoralis]AWB69107.1 flagellar protein MotX [Saccharobesus litoralis]
MFKLYSHLLFIALLISLCSRLVNADELRVVQIYEQDDLIKWINNNQHLTRVVEDKCQLVQDIQARAEIVKTPAYQFLWGDMLAWGVCIERNAELGLYYMKEAAHQGLPAALEQLGRYYHKGTLVQVDIKRALEYLRESAAQGNLKAQFRLVDMFNQGLGSPLDYEYAYHWLHNAIIVDKKQHKRAQMALAKLAEKMPAKLVNKAKRPLIR